MDDNAFYDGLLITLVVALILGVYWRFAVLGALLPGALAHWGLHRERTRARRAGRPHAGGRPVGPWLAGAAGGLVGALLMELFVRNYR